MVWRAVVLTIALGCKHDVTAPRRDSATPPAAEAIKPRSIEAQARELVALLDKGDFDRVVAEFDPAMMTHLPKEQLVATWKGLVGQVGPLHGCTAKTEGLQVTLNCMFGRTPLDLRVTIDSSLRISGLRIVPGTVKQPWSPPPYEAKDAIAQDVTVGADPWDAAGHTRASRG